MLAGKDVQEGISMPRAPQGPYGNMNAGALIVQWPPSFEFGFSRFEA